MVVDRIKSLLGWDSDDNGAQALKAALVEPRTEVDLYGSFDEPRLDPQGAKTAVFGVTLRDAETAEEYGSVEVEFEIETDSGREALEDFLDAHGVDNVFDLDQIEGERAEVERDESGNITVQW